MNKFDWRTEGITDARRVYSTGASKGLMDNQLGMLSNQYICKLQNLQLPAVWIAPWKWIAPPIGCYNINVGITRTIYLSCQTKLKLNLGITIFFFTLIDSKY